MWLVVWFIKISDGDPQYYHSEWKMLRQFRSVVDGGNLQECLVGGLEYTQTDSAAIPAELKQFQIGHDNIFHFTLTLSVLSGVVDQTSVRK